MLPAVSVITVKRYLMCPWLQFAGTQSFYVWRRTRREDGTVSKWRLKREIGSLRCEKEQDDGQRRSKHEEQREVDCQTRQARRTPWSCRLTITARETR